MSTARLVPRIIPEDHIRQAVGLDKEALAVIRRAFAALAEGKVEMPPVMRLDVPAHNGEMDTKTAYIEGLPYFALKISCGFFDNPARGLPSLGGMMALFESETGQPVAVLLDNGYLTDIRTALAGALAADYLARDDVARIGVIGTGQQARLQIAALRLVRDVSHVRVWGRGCAQCDSYCADMAATYGIDVDVCDDIESLVRDSDLVVTTTPATSPLIKADWLHPGLHITAMGSDAPEKNELDPYALLRADLYVCDHHEQCRTLGELNHGVASGIIPPDDFPLTALGMIAAGEKPGRQNKDQVTICDLTGTGAQDTAIANYACRLMFEDG